VVWNFKKTRNFRSLLLREGVADESLRSNYFMQKVLVVGLGKSGVAACRLLAKRGDDVFVTEIKDDSAVCLSIDELIKDRVIHKDNFEKGAHTKKFIELCDLVVVSPGVKPDSLPVKLAEGGNIL